MAAVAADQLVRLEQTVAAAVLPRQRLQSPLQKHSRSGSVVAVVGEMDTIIVVVVVAAAATPAYCEVLPNLSLPVPAQAAAAVIMRVLLQPEPVVWVAAHRAEPEEIVTPQQAVAVETRAQGVVPRATQPLEEI